MVAGVVGEGGKIGRAFLRHRTQVLCLGPLCFLSFLRRSFDVSGGVHGTRYDRVIILLYSAVLFLISLCHTVQNAMILFLCLVL